MRPLGFLYPGARRTTSLGRLPNEQTQESFLEDHQMKRPCVKYGYPEGREGEGDG